MSEKWTREEVNDKVDWEGGVSEAITGYGLGPDVLPDDTPLEIHAAWKRIQESQKDIRLIGEWLETGEMNPEYM